MKVEKLACGTVGWFDLVPVNNYGHVGTVSSLKPHFFPGQA